MSCQGWNQAPGTGWSTCLGTLRFISIHAELFDTLAPALTVWQRRSWLTTGAVLGAREAGRCCYKVNGSITVLETVLRKSAYTQHNPTLAAVEAVEYSQCWLTVWIKLFFSYHCCRDSVNASKQKWKNKTLNVSAELENGRNGMPVYVILAPVPTHIASCKTQHWIQPFAEEFKRRWNSGCRLNSSGQPPAARLSSTSDLWISRDSVHLPPSSSPPPPQPHKALAWSN